MKRYKLDTVNAGYDEILYGDSLGEVTQDVLNRYECDELPEGWTIEEIGATYTTEPLTCGPGWNIHGSISATELAGMINDFFDAGWDNPNPTGLTIQLVEKGGERIKNGICLFCPGSTDLCFAPGIDASVNFLCFDEKVVYSPTKERILQLCEEACL